MVQNGRWLKLTGVAALIVLGICISWGARSAGPVKSTFYVCSNSGSPAAFDRSDFVPPCCDGTVETKPLTRKNLMQALDSVSRALRAVSIGRGGEVSGPETLAGKADCFARSIAFIAGAMGSLPPEKSQDNPTDYATLLNNLTARGRAVQTYIGMNDKEKSVIAYKEYQKTCGQCHAVFR